MHSVLSKQAELQDCRRFAEKMKRDNRLSIRDHLRIYEVDDAGNS